MLVVMSLLLPIVQLVILGHAFGGRVRHLKVGLVDQDHGVPAMRIRELSNAIAANAETFELIPYDDPGQALGSAVSDGSAGADPRARGPAGRRAGRGP